MHSYQTNFPFAPHLTTNIFIKRTLERALFFFLRAIIITITAVFIVGCGYYPKTGYTIHAYVKIVIDEEEYQKVMEVSKNENAKEMLSDLHYYTILSAVHQGVSIDDVREGRLVIAWCAASNLVQDNYGSYSTAVLLPDDVSLRLGDFVEIEIGTADWYNPHGTLSKLRRVLPKCTSMPSDRLSSPNWIIREWSPVLEKRGSTEVCTDYSDRYIECRPKYQYKSQTKLANLYQDGEGVERNYAEAPKWFRKAADQGNADAQQKLGHMYLYGTGIEKNVTFAASLYKKAAEQGAVTAMVKLGNIYDFGYGGLGDKRKAVKWYRKAVEQGEKKEIKSGE